MPAGTDPAGTSPGGLASVEAPTFKPVIVLPVALAYDGAKKDLVRNTDGVFESIHPVDQEVILAMSQNAGTLSSVPGLGNTLRKIEFLDPIRINRQAETRVRNALSRLTGRQAIFLRSIVVETPEDARGRLLVAVDYINLVISPDSRRRVLTDPASGETTLQVPT